MDTVTLRNSGLGARGATESGAETTSGQEEPNPNVPVLGIEKEEDIAELPVSEIKRILDENNANWRGCYEKPDLVAKLTELWRNLSQHELKSALSKLISDGLQFADDTNDFQCCNCYQVPVWVQISSCNHIYCQDCYKVIHKHRGSCRICPSKIVHQMTQDNEKLERQIFNLATICPHQERGCKENVPLRMLPNHLDRCEYAGEDVVTTRPIQIVMCNGKNFEMNIEALEQILIDNDIVDHQVFIISVNGNTRSGKSFLLNFFIRHTQDSYRKCTGGYLNGFHWRGGVKPVTSGIWVWSKPITVRSRDGRDIAVLLMDVQGLFDQHTGKKGNEILFWLSCMLSSTFVYNIKGDLTQDKLEHLEFFSSSVKMNTSTEEDMERSDIPFPKLVFVIRDWPNSAEFQYGMHYRVRRGHQEIHVPSEGNYLQFLSPDESDEQSINTFQSICRDFTQVEFCLLPFPGECVACHSKRVPLDKMKVEFLEHVEQFVEYQLHPDRLGSKVIDDCIANGKALLKHAHNLEEALSRQRDGHSLSMKDYHFTWELHSVIDKNLIVYNNTISSESVETLDIATLVERHNHMVMKITTNVQNFSRSNGNVDLGHQLLESTIADLDDKFSALLQKKLDLIHDRVITTYREESLKVDLNDLTTDMCEDHLRHTMDNAMEEVRLQTDTYKDNETVQQFCDKIKEELSCQHNQHRDSQLQLLNVIEVFKANIIEHALEELKAKGSSDRSDQSFASLCAQGFNEKTGVLEDRVLVERYLFLLETYLIQQNDTNGGNLRKLKEIKSKFDSDSLKVHPLDFVHLHKEFSKLTLEVVQLIATTMRMKDMDQYNVRLADIVRITVKDKLRQLLIDQSEKTVSDCDQDMSQVDLTQLDETNYERNLEWCRDKYSQLLEKLYSIVTDYDIDVRKSTNLATSKLNQCTKNHKDLHKLLKRSLDNFYISLQRQQVNALKTNEKTIAFDSTLRVISNRCSHILQQSCSRESDDRLAQVYQNKLDDYLAEARRSLCKFFDFEKSSIEEYNKFFVQANGKKAKFKKFFKANTEFLTRMKDSLTLKTDPLHDRRLVQSQKVIFATVLEATLEQRWIERNSYLEDQWVIAKMFRYLFGEREPQTFQDAKFHQLTREYIEGRFTSTKRYLNDVYALHSKSVRPPAAINH